MMSAWAQVVSTAMAAYQLLETLSRLLIDDQIIKGARPILQEHRRARKERSKRYGLRCIAVVNQALSFLIISIPCQSTTSLLLA